MLIIQLIWQEVYKMCQFQVDLDLSVMVTQLCLAVIILAVFATTVANAGILCMWGCEKLIKRFNVLHMQELVS